MIKGITSHTIIRNEDRFVWFSVNSVLRYVDKMLIFDTGSTDRTIEIIKSIKSQKVFFEERGEVNAKQMIGLRQEQLDRTTTEWFLTLDGDEVWWDESIQAVVNTAQIAKENIWGIITPTINCIGDIFHYQEEKAGRYRFADYFGHFAVRTMRRNIPGLHLYGTYPLEGYRDSKNKKITDYDDRLLFLDKPYLHLTNLERSTDRKKVISRQKKYELGIPFAKDFKYPQAFYKKYPSFVPLPWEKLSGSDRVRATIETPLKKIKRKVF